MLTFSVAKSMGLLEEDAPLGSTLTNMLQGLNRFLLDRFSTDYRNVQPRSPTFDQVSTLYRIEISS